MSRKKTEIEFYYIPVNGEKRRVQRFDFGNPPERSNVAWMGHSYQDGLNALIKLNTARQGLDEEFSFVFKFGTPIHLEKIRVGDIVQFKESREWRGRCFGKVRAKLGDWITVYVEARTWKAKITWKGKIEEIVWAWRPNA